MAEDQNSEQMPKSPFHLYTQLFCKRKAQNNVQNGKTIIEATKSWLSLSKNEKQLFIDKHKEYNTKYKQMFAEYLKNAEPYMQKKKRITNIIDKGHCELNKSSTINTIIDNKDDYQRYASPLPMLVDEPPKEENIEKQPELPEPIAPKIKTARELFELVKTRNSDKSDLTWSMLTNSEKQPYHKAVLAIKKDYLANYKAYLESLPSEKLFEHYHKVL